jgi:hypothetical protein
MRPVRALFAAALLHLGCAPARPLPEASSPEKARPSDEPAAVLEAFAAALDEGRFEAAYALLSARWRARETPARLANDLATSGSVGQDAVRRVRALLSAGARPTLPRADLAVLDIGVDAAARLVREGDGWRVDALE